MLVASLLPSSCRQGKSLISNTLCNALNEAVTTLAAAASAPPPAVVVVVVVVVASISTASTSLATANCTSSWACRATASSFINANTASEATAYIQVVIVRVVRCIVVKLISFYFISLLLSFPYIPSLPLLLHAALPPS